MDEARGEGNSLPTSSQPKSRLATHLSHLRELVAIARVHLQEGRGNSKADEANRAELLAALETLAASLAKVGSPIPYRLRDEISLLKAMFRHGSQRGGGRSGRPD